MFNEKPSHEDRIAITEEDKSGPRYFETAVIHTTLGDIVLKLFPQECPKTVENFCVHAKNNYFNGHIFHRVNSFGHNFFNYVSEILLTCFSTNEIHSLVGYQTVHDSNWRPHRSGNWR